jgi:acylpyruvate hydrolase
MKLATYRPADPQAPEPGVGAVADGRLIDLNYAFAAYLHGTGEHRARAIAAARVPRDMLALLGAGRPALEDASSAIGFVQQDSRARGIDGERLSYRLDEVRLLAPIPRPGKILGAGKNYADHAAESGGGGPVELRPFPGGFVKVSSVVIGPDDPVQLPHVTTELDWEVELAVVIGRPGRYISRASAYDYVAGYTILNDISARDIQREESRYGNHMVAKNMDGLSPMGPWIVTADEFGDPADVRVQLRVNGELRQDASTASLIHDIPAIIERWSWMTFEPGDVIATGTPAGVALGGKFPYLKIGDVMECDVERIGKLRNEVVAEDS